jgi:hypothetical protein
MGIIHIDEGEEFDIEEAKSLVPPVPPTWGPSPSASSIESTMGLAIVPFVKVKGEPVDPVVDIGWAKLLDFAELCDYDDDDVEDVHRGPSSFGDVLVKTDGVVFADLPKFDNPFMLPSIAECMLSESLNPAQQGARRLHKNQAEAKAKAKAEAFVKATAKAKSCNQVKITPVKNAKAKPKPSPMKQDRKNIHSRAYHRARAEALADGKSDEQAKDRYGKKY